jgi:hypothetical protein
LSDDIVFISVDPTPVVLETSIGSEPPILDVYVNRGEKGETGATGATGEAGATGSQGPVGPVGPQGSQGPIGSVGPVGPMGDKGETGAVGPKGDKGDVGNTGPAGPIGETGPVGPVGPIGETGPQGPVGEGVAEGGLTGQLLAKVDDTDYNTFWVDNPSEQTLFLVRNVTGSTILKGTLVSAVGSEPSGRVDVAPFVVTGLEDSELRVMGVALTNIANNNNGSVMNFGTLRQIDTRGNVASAIAVGDETWAAGDILFAHPTVAGKLTKVRPQHDLAVAFITRLHQSAGQIAVRIVPGNAHLEWLHDVAISSPVNNQVLTYDSSTNLWKNATNPADGVTSITATAPLTGGTITGVGSIGLDQSGITLAQSQVTGLVAELANDAKINAANTFSVGGHVINNSGTTVVPLQINGLSGQTSDLLQVRDSSGNNNLSVSPTYGLVGRNAGTLSFAISSGAGLAAFYATAPANVPMLLRGAVSQSANLQVWQDNNANTLAQVTSGGSIQTGANLTAGTLTALGRLTVNTGNAATIAEVVRGAASQTANLTEWQNSAGSLLARVEPSGKIVGGQNITSLGSMHSFNIMTSGTNEAQLGSATLSVGTRAAGNVGAVIRSAASQTASVFETQDVSGSVRFYIDAAHNTNFSPNSWLQNSTGRLTLGLTSASAVGLTVRGAASQTANLQEWQNSAATVLGRFEPTGDLWVTGAVRSLFYTNRLNTGAYFDFSTGTPAVIQRAPAEVGMQIRGAASQTADLFQVENSSLTDLFAISSAGQITAKVVGNAANQSRGLMLSNTADTWQSGLYLRSDGSGFPRLSLLAPTGALGEAVSIDSAAKVGIGNVAPVAQLDVYSQAAARVGVVIRGAASQTASLTAWQNNAGGLVATMSAAGDLALYGNGITSGDHRVGTASYLSATLNVQARAASEKGLVVRGFASQTANLQDWQNSAGTILGFVNSGGVARFENVGTANGFAVLGYNASGGHNTLVRANATMANPGANTGRLYFRDGTNAGTLKLVVIAGASGAETTILDNIPQ